MGKLTEVHPPLEMLELQMHVELSNRNSQTWPCAGAKPHGSVEPCRFPRQHQWDFDDKT